MAKTNRKSGKKKVGKNRTKKRASSVSIKPIKAATKHPTSRLTKAEKIARIPIEDIVKASKDNGLKELVDNVRSLRSGYKRRVASFKSRGIISYAQIALEEGRLGPEKPVNKLTRNQLLLEFARYSKFFNDKTSSIKGAIEVNRAQDVRIFGQDKRGKPLREMTDMERKRFWTVYEEFNIQHPNGIAIYSSDKIQQAIGRVIEEGKRPETDFMSLLDMVHNELQKEYENTMIGRIPNVYTGRGDN